MVERRLKTVKKIFISSPSDVYQERLKAEIIVKRLDAEFSEFLRVESVCWERKPLKANAGPPQASIVDPGDTDIVVVILWSRLGTPLSDRQGSLSNKPVTGTEYEFEQALASFQSKQKPDILVYRKTAEVSLPPGDRDARNQLDALESFIEDWFIDPDTKTFKRGFRDFKTTTDFEEILEEHLRDLLGNDKKLSSIVFYKGNPFRGLYSFELKDAPVFFGRTQARNELYKLLQERIRSKNAFVLVHGASGCGKSSLVKSGLLADLTASIRIAYCRYAVFRPTDGADDLVQGLASSLFVNSQDSPYQALPELTELGFTPQNLKSQLSGNREQVILPIQQALLKIKKDPKNFLDSDTETRLVLIIDQLEELFTGTYTKEHQEIFIKILTIFAQSGLVWIIATIRSDFLDRIDQLPSLSSLCSQQALYSLRFPESHEIEQIIRKPANLAGLEFEFDKKKAADLADHLCQDISTAPLSLPLLEFTLDQLWQQRTPEGVLTFTAYDNLGGLEGALGRRAEEIFSKLPEEVQRALPSLLSALATADQGLNAKVTARSASFDKLSASKSLHQLMEAFLDPEARLLVTDGDEKTARVRVSHEALLNHWPRAHEQLAKDLPDLQIRSRLMQMAIPWQAAHRTQDWLLPGGQPLVEAEGLLARREAEMEDLLVEYIKTSIAADQAEKKRIAFRSKAVFSAISSLAVLALLLAGLFYYQKQKAQEQHSIAESGVSSGLAAQALTLADEATDDQTAERAAAFASESWRLIRNPEAVNAANKLFKMLPKFHTQHDALITAIAMSPDSRLLATGAGNGELRLIEITSGKTILNLPIETSGRIFTMAFSPDSRLLAIGSEDAKARLLEIPTGKIVAALPHAGEVHKLCFNPDGRLLATASGDENARVFEVLTKQELHKFKHSDAVRYVAFHPDGKKLATGSYNGLIRLIDVTNGNDLIAPIKQGDPGSPVNQVVFSPDGLYLATAGQGGEVLVIELNSGNIIYRFKHAKAVFSVAFHPRQPWLATAGDDSYARLFDLATGKEITRFAHFNSVFSVRFSRNGQFLATSSMDNSARLFATSDWHEITRILHGGPVWQLAISEDSNWLATGSDKVARIIETALNPEDIRVRHQDAVFDVALNPKRKLLATASKDATAKLIDISTGDAKTFKHNDTVYAVAFSMDGRFLATASKDHTAKLINLDAATEFTILHNDEVRSIAFSSDNRLLATAGLDKMVKLITTENGQTVKQFAMDEAIGFTIFDNSNEQLAMAGENGLIKLVNLKTYETKEIKLQASINRMDFSPDGRFLATADQDGFARLIRLSDQQQKQFKHSDAVLNVVFSPNGKQLAMSSMDNTARLIDINTDKQIALINHAGPVTAIAFNWQGSLLATGSQDGIIRIIDTATGQEWERISYNDAIWTLSFDKDGQWLAAGGIDGSVQLHNADPVNIINRLCKERAGRNLNKDEIKRYMPIGLNHPTCEQWRNPGA